MKEFLKKIKINSLVLSLLALLIGLAALIHPDAVTIGLCRVLGAGILIAGISSIVSYFTSERSAVLKAFEVLFGVIFSVIGIWILVKPQGIVRFVYVILGVILIVNGLTDIRSFSLLSLFGKRKLFYTLIPAITIVLGVVVLFNPFSTGAAVMRFAGASLVIGSITGILTILRAATIVRQASAPDPLTIDADNVTIE